MIGNISSIDTMGLVDGPGIRVVIFMQGCHLRCRFCHNPETWDFKTKKRQYNPNEMMNFILKYKPYFKDGGGVTFSGGEPLCQKKFLLEVLKKCKKQGIHTCIDTAGYSENYDEIIDYVDLIIMDIKSIFKEQYKDITGKEIDRSLRFLEACHKKNKRMWIRQVIVPGINDNEQYVFKLKEFLSKYDNIEKIELLPYHTMGVTKYKNMNIPYTLNGVLDMDKKRLKELEKILQ